MINRNVLPFATIFLVFSFLASSCANTKRVYFENQQNGTIATNAVIPPTVIQENDILSISVSSLNAAAAAIFNNPNVSSSLTNSVSTGLATPFIGYVVGSDGNIQFPMLGSLPVKGLTINQLRETIIKDILDKKYLVDPIVNVRYLNFKVTVLGEVARPQVINVPNQKISLLEALGIAGDITIYGKKENVLVIREEENSKKTFHRINMNSNELFDSPFYYLKTNDVVYVEPTKGKISASSRATTLLPIVLSGLSFLAIIIDRTTR